MSPSRQHEHRKAMLGAIATLSGYDLFVPSALPDGSQPDVLHLASAWKGIFIGEAKHTESPSNNATLARLQRYLRWVAGLSKEGWRFSMVVCHPSATGGRSWENSLRYLAREVELDQVTTSICQLDPLTAITTLQRCHKAPEEKSHIDLVRLHQPI